MLQSGSLYFFHLCAYDLRNLERVLELLRDHERHNRLCSDSITICHRVATPSQYETKSRCGRVLRRSNCVRRLDHRRIAHLLIPYQGHSGLVNADRLSQPIIQLAGPHAGFLVHHAVHASGSESQYHHGLYSLPETFLRKSRVRHDPERRPPPPRGKMAVCIWELEIYGVYHAGLEQESVPTRQIIRCASRVGGTLQHEEFASRASCECDHEHGDER